MKFHYSVFNIDSKLPSSWRGDLIEFAEIFEEKIILESNSVTSRESEKTNRVETLIVNGNKIKENIPWLFDLYRGLFYDYAKKCSKEEVVIAKNPLYAINLNIQRGNKMRYECHVDSNPLQGLLYVTSHPEGSGGELIVANNPNALGVDEIEQDCTKIYPSAGDLVFFDARNHPHYVTSLQDENGIRISVAMNFYTSSSTEEERPEDLNNHLFN